MNKPSISIIIPVYQVEPYIEDCIRSVIRQTYDGVMECIFVDDCGTDNSMAIVEELIAGYSGPISFKILHHTHNRGLSAARNTGMKAAIGNYIYFLDSDDEITDDCIERLISCASSNPNTEIVQGNTRAFPAANPDVFNVSITLPHSSSNKEARLCYFKHRQFIPNAWNKLIKRSFIVNNRFSFKEGVLFEDVLWTFFLLKHAKNVYYIPNITYLYRRRPNSIITGSDKHAFYTNNKILYSEILANLTPGYEHEELKFYSKRFSGSYITNRCPEYAEIFRLFWKKARTYKCYDTFRILAFAYIYRIVFHAKKAIFN